MARHMEVTGSGGVRLAAREFTGTREPAGTAEAAGPLPGVLLLHGLMGCAAHWESTADWLAPRFRTVALDQRGHGRSEKPATGPWTREAYVADAEAAVEQLGLGPAVLIGHSMGALTAWQLAARRPDLVRALVICDMRASALGAASQRAWEDWFGSWPLPFASLDAVRRWFGADDPRLERPDPSRGAFYARVMRQTGDGWRPVFEPRQMLSSRERWVYDAHWDDLAAVRCPTLVVRGLDGELGRAEAQEMVRVLPHGAYAEVPEAGHLVHHDRPEDWRAVVEPFLEGALRPKDDPAQTTARATPVVPPQSQLPSRIEPFRD
ncbi:alpha/beta hydrolase [Streptomyces sp. NA04227]|uniref:alpha/beta fold hydrolase n=1 Tax=Streptomyces sp. NA04227 TaxID=2742136 RepID=UPI0015926214|nr:alpha/beta hydrolase [Streptomyces sp. NA04227]QKW07189.1 alpha/beta hydrolase [Streptomyces sp. NA04227]